MKLLLLLVMLMVLPLKTIAAEYRSSFGFPFTLSGDWKVITPKDAAAMYKGKSLKSLGWRPKNNKQAKALLAQIKHGDVEYYVDRKFSTNRMLNNISVKLVPGDPIPTPSEVRALCKAGPRRMSLLYGKGTRLESCKFLKENGVPYFGFQFQPAHFPEKGLTVIQRQIPYLSHTTVQLMGGSNAAGLNHMKKAVEKLVFSITHYVAQNKHAQTPSVADVISPDEQKALVSSTMHAFAMAVNARNFSAFRKRIAPEMRGRMTVSRLNHTFKSFMEHHLNLLALDGVTPKFTKAPSIDTNGILEFNGYYPGGRFQVPFEFAYKYEQAVWKLVAVDVHIRRATHPVTGKIPSRSRQLSLVKLTMHQFATAMNTGNFAEFYKQISELWRLQITPRGLEQTFRPRGSRHANLLALDKMAPHISRTPTINKNGVLSLDGYYRIPPSRLMFKLGYVYEQSSWKLLSIDIYGKHPS